MMLMYETPDGTVGEIVFDDFLESDHGSDVDITKHPISQKAKISDHIRPGLKELKGTAVATNDPIAPHALLNGVKTRGGAQVVPQSQNDGGTTRTELVFQTLEEIKKNGYLCTVFTLLDVYFNMVIKSSRVKVGKHGINALEFALEFEELRIARVQTVPAPRTRFIRTSGKSKKGGNATEKASDETKKDVIKKAFPDVPDVPDSELFGVFN